MLFIGSTGISTSVSATDADWIHGAPIVVKSTRSTMNPATECEGEFVDGATIKACFFAGHGIKIGYTGDMGSNKGAVQFPFSDEVYPLEGICEGVLCQYVADRDMLVTQRHSNSSGFGTVVFLHASKRIESVHTSTGNIRYVFDTMHPDFEVMDGAGQYIWTSSFSLSNNGAWLIMELNGIGLLLVNTDSFESKLIKPAGYLYSKFAVSNDGKNVAVTAINTGLSVIEVNKTCGLVKIEHDPQFVGCPMSAIDTNTLLHSFSPVDYPHFSDDGHHLSVIIRRGNEVQRVVFLEHGASPPRSLELLALGDSFTSGEGETDMSYYEAGTNDSVDNCHVSRRAYPFLVAMKIGIPQSNMQSVACAGAKVGDIIGSSDTYWGQGNRLGDSGLKLSVSDKTAVQAKAVDIFQPGRALQSVFLERYNPEMITVGVGGNDAGLMGKLSVCAMPDTCEWAKGEGLQATAGEIKRLFDTLGTLFSHISKEYHDTKVYVVGYPDIIDANGVCDPVTGILLDYTERVFIEQSLEYLNQIVHAATQKAGFTFLDIEKSMKGKALCSDVVSEAMNGIRLGDDIAVISRLPMLKIIGAGTFHPTPLGHALVADSILSAHPGLSQDATCVTDPMACVTPLVSTVPPSYWGVTDGNKNRQSYVSAFVTLADESSNKLIIHVPNSSFEPQSTVRVEIHSETTLLGTMTTNVDGGLDGAVSIPLYVEPGFHTLHLLGDNSAGDTIDVYQFVTIDQKGEAVGGVGIGNGGSGAVATDSQDVLGVRDVKTKSLVVASSPPKLIHDARRVTQRIGLLIYIIGGSIATLITVFIILKRRWAKPAS
ncbi:MAG: hypothetical protein JWO99_112 [Candidatus Saccharibacteria bacterium]|nr:hypothetical protein [Candidatus Saccharibacteria bacterium]